MPLHLTNSWKARRGGIAAVVAVTAVLVLVIWQVVFSEGVSSGVDSARYPPHNPNEILVDVQGIPFLIPKGYFRNPRYMRDGPASELGLHASVPDINDDGAAVQSDPGYGRYISIGMFPPSVRTNMKPGRLYTEQVLWNLVKGKSLPSQFNTIPEFVKRTFRPKLEKLIAENKDNNDVLIDASDIFGWSTAGTSPEQSDKYYFVAFSAGRVSIFSECTKSKPGILPSCWAYAHFPEYQYSISAVFDREYLSLTIELAERIYGRLESFNEHAIALLGVGGALRTQAKPD